MINPRDLEDPVGPGSGDSLEVDVTTQSPPNVPSTLHALRSWEGAGRAGGGWGEGE